MALTTDQFVAERNELRAKWHGKNTDLTAHNQHMDEMGAIEDSWHEWLAATYHGFLPPFLLEQVIDNAMDLDVNNDPHEYETAYAAMAEVAKGYLRDHPDVVVIYEKA